MANELVWHESIEVKDISANEYQRAALRTLNEHLDETMPKLTLMSLRLSDGLMGLNGEAGECIDILKKHMFQGHSLDVEHMAKELGDVAWYLAVSANAIGYSLNDIFLMNIKKLEARYPNGFETERSINREEGDI